MAADLTLLKPRYERAKDRMWRARTRWQELAEFLLPYQSNIIVQGWEGRKKTVRLYHSHGIAAADKLARTMHGSITSPAQQWHSLVMRQAELRKIKPIEEWLEEIDQRLYLTRNQSNFSMEIGRLYGSLVPLATSGIYVEEGETKRAGQFGGLQYAFMPIGSFSIEQNAAGQIDTLYRDLKWPLRDLLREFGEDIGMDLVRRAAERPDEEIEFVHAIYPRKARDPRRADARNMPWASCYFRLGGEHGPQILRESGFPEQPFMVPRWDVAQNEIWGTGPGHVAYPDVRSLNRTRELKLAAAGVAVYPPMLQTKGLLLSQVNLSPGAVMLREAGNEEVLTAFDNKAKFDVAKLTEEDMVQAINAMFYVLELMLPDKPNMTLGEAQIRVEQQMRLLGPTMARLESELLKPLIERELGLMSRGGALPPPPPELLELVDVAEIDIRYEGPLARAQRSAELVAIERTNQWVQGVSPFAPSVADNFDYDEQARTVAEVTGLPATNIKDAGKVAEMRQARSQAQQQAQALAAAGQVADAAGSAAPALKEMREAGQPQGQGQPA